MIHFCFEGCCSVDYATIYSVMFRHATILQIFCPSIAKKQNNSRGMTARHSEEVRVVLKQCAFSSYVSRIALW